MSRLKTRDSSWSVWRLCTRTTSQKVELQPKSFLPALRKVHGTLWSHRTLAHSQMHASFLEPHRRWSGLDVLGECHNMIEGLIHWEHLSNLDSRSVSKMWKHWTKIRLFLEKKVHENLISPTNFYLISLESTAFISFLNIIPTVCDMSFVGVNVLNHCWLQSIGY